MKSGLKIGVLAVQGAFIEHKRMLETLGCECVELRKKSDICDLDGLVLPGGESTVQGKLLRELDMFDELKGRIANGLPVLATCAGLILLASHISNMEEGALVEAGDVLFTIKSTDYDLQQTQLEDNRKSYEEQISQYSLLIKSIKDDTNYFDETKADDGLYWSLFETYKSQVEQNKVDVSTYQAYGYTDEQIQAQLETNQGKIDEVYYSAIQSAETKIEEANLQIASIDAQLAAVTSGQDAYEVKATTSGVLHMLGNYKSGMVVQTTTTVATITPENSQRYLEAYVSTSDMARMHEGDRVQVVMDGLSQNVYGTISGSVSRIDSNVTTQEGQDGATSRAFKVMIVLDQDYVLSREGDKVDVTNGMTAAARIQYDKVTYFNYVLEKLGIKTGK